MVHLSERELELPDAVIAKLIKMAVEDRSIISLGPGEPDMNTFKPIIKYTKRFAKKCNHYSPPGGRLELKEGIIKKLKKDNKINAGVENIIVTSGSQEALLLAAACSCDVSEEIIVPSPSYMGYISAIELLNINPVLLELKRSNKFEVNPDELKKIIDKKRTKAIILNSPANPTGSIIRRNILEEIADIAVDNDVYIFSDEAYEKITYNKKFVSIGSLNGMHNHVVTLHSFSKTYAMCGYRLGYAVGPRKLIDAMTMSHVYSTIAAPTISQLVGAKALEIKQKYIDKMVETYRKRRDLIVRRLNEMDMDTIMPDGAFYAFSGIRNFDKKSSRFAANLLKNAKVAVVPGVEFGRYGEGNIRCSYATDIKLIEEAMYRIEKLLKHSKST